MKNNYDKPIKIRYKLILVGETSVGKTCIVTRAICKPFNSSILETVGVNIKDITIVKDGIHYTMQVWDTAGVEKLRVVVSQLLPRTDCVFFVYAINYRASFAGIHSWLEKVKISNKNPKLKMVLIGNKCDLLGKEIYEEEEQALTQEYYMAFFEMSAKDNTGVNECFQYITDEAIKVNLDKDYEI